MPFPQSYFPDRINIPLPGSENEDPNFIRNPAYLELAKQNAALHGLQLANDGVQQKMKLADPEQQRIEAANNADFETGMVNDGAYDAIDKHSLDKMAQTLGLQNQLKLNYEGDPRHLAPIEAASDAKVLPAIIAAQAKAGAAGQPKPNDVQTSKQVAAIDNFKTLADQIMPMLDKLDQYGGNYRNMGILSKLPGIGYSNYQNYLYQHGMPTSDVEGKVDQLVSLAQGLAIAGMTTGRPSTQWIELLQKHLADPSQPVGEIKSRIQELIDIMPQFRENILGARYAQPGQGGAAGGSDPLGIR
jgi:hypothetical protein